MTTWFEYQSDDKSIMIAVGFDLAATLIWFAPKPKGPIDISGAH